MCTIQGFHSFCFSLKLNCYITGNHRIYFASHLQHEVRYQLSCEIMSNARISSLPRVPPSPRSVPSSQEPQARQTSPSHQEPQALQTSPSSQEPQARQTSPSSQEPQARQTSPSSQELR